MNQQKVNIERPSIVSLLCVLGVIGIALTAYFLLTAPPGKYEPWQYYWWGGSNLLMLAAFYGIWQMRKWGANIYTVVAIVNITVLLLIGKDFFIELIFAAVVIFILLRNYSKMR